MLFVVVLFCTCSRRFVRTKFNKATQLSCTEAINYDIHLPASKIGKTQLKVMRENINLSFVTLRVKAFICKTMRGRLMTYRVSQVSLLLSLSKYFLNFWIVDIILTNPPQISALILCYYRLCYKRLSNT